MDDRRLPERFQRVLERSLARWRAEPEVCLVQLFGSVQRRQISNHSDIDLYILTDRREFWRGCEVVEGVELELFFCPPDVLRKRLLKGDALALQAFATGEPLLDRDGCAAGLMALARRLFQQGPTPMTPSQIIAHRALLTRVVQKLERLAPDSPEALCVAGEGIQRAITAFYQHYRLWTHGMEHTLQDISRHDSRIAELLLLFYQEGQPSPRALAFIDGVLELLGGRLVAYESERIPC